MTDDFKYILLTPEHKLNLLRSRLLEFEAQHYQQQCEVNGAEAVGDEALLQATINKRDSFAKLIESTRLDYADVEAEFTAWKNIQFQGALGTHEGEPTGPE